MSIIKHCLSVYTTGDTGETFAEAWISLRLFGKRVSFWKRKEKVSGGSEGKDSGREPKEYTVKAVMKVDTSQLDKARKKAEGLRRTLEKANSLYDELASKEIVVGITSELRQPCRSVGIHWLRGLRQRCFRNVDK